MDYPLNQVNRILLDAGLPSTIENLKNPTEEYVMTLLTSFLSRFDINVNLIDQPTVEQSATMTYFMDSDIINLINLRAALTQIFNKIHLCDFYITDITDPRHKRLRRQAKYIANFILYAMQKKLDFSDKIDEIQTRYKLLEEYHNKMTQIKESINNKAVHKAKQLSLIKKLEDDIQQMRLNLDDNNKKELQIEQVINAAEKEHHKAKELCRSVKSTITKLSKAVDDLQSEVVHSPEKIQSRLKELEEEQNSKMEERAIMQEAIQDKKQSIKQIETELDVVEGIHDELATLKNIYEELMTQKAQSHNIKKQIESVNNVCVKQQSVFSMHKDQLKTEIKKFQSLHEDDIVPLHDLQKQLLSEKKLKKAELDANKVHFNDKCLRRNKLYEEIKIKEEETDVLIHNFQKAYDSEIAKELELREKYKEL